MKTTRNASGRVATVDLFAQTQRLPVAGTKLRGALGLRSTWFDVGILSLAPPAPSAPVVYGSTVTLTGFVRGVSGVSFEQRPLVDAVADRRARSRPPPTAPSP